MEKTNLCVINAEKQAKSFNPLIRNGFRTTLFQGSLQLTISKTTGLPTKITIPEVSESTKFEQSILYYESALGNNAIFANRSSGAYIFRPNSSLLSINSKPTIKYYKGNIV